MHNFGV